ncbi:hypothetical protein VITU102760_24900 [Vibrio tubiashii]|uniref:Uncharacterized protein n=1 Tax=Vibrio tubiashii ATCC 19109 TaxID=1051646 RepID=F9T6R2_9VIBR|nr:hypothetical protein [Vibrio tubiashii]AIW17537.1 hypothetical protein IX91_26120 [Vibrio tubiashii ATCC 19109]EGU54467.1 hypothetical protein VITU9109_02797 [Vibrio tubiashii ATCC 19109]EIF04226.1 hypothetical protein VT1337_09557 [Vibrio tubiashii NCIMB 1337 = ATCC 19106]
MELSIKESRKRFFIMAGKSCLSTGFKSMELAETDLKNRQSFYKYWANSIGVSIENTEPIVKHI